MGRATRWLKGLLGMKNNSNSNSIPNPNKENERQNPKFNPSPTPSINLDKKEKRRWSFAKSSKDGGGGGPRGAPPPLRQIPVNKDKDMNTSGGGGWLKRDYHHEVNDGDKEQNKHAIAVAAATAAAADAAVAAAQAAFAVVRLTSQGRGSGYALFTGTSREKWAALKIQTVFRGYLARRAHRALKALVKLQAHVRGFLVRKRATATLRGMQALFRAQATARSQRARRGFTKDIRLPPEFRHRRSLERFDETRISTDYHSKRHSASYDPYDSTTYDNSPKIVEIDTYKPRSRSRRINPSTTYDYPEDIGYPTISSPLPYPAPSRLSIPENSKNLHDYDWGFYYDECRISTAHSTPRFANKSFRTSDAPSTPARSVCGGGDGYFRQGQHGTNDYYYCPNYMANTKSFRAKVRSQSAPRQRPEICPSPKKMLSLNEIMASRSSISSVRSMHRCDDSKVQEGLS